ncbi:MAG: suppressor of fused domain protein [Lachnospiraceae bacterium]|nr:suppressor of fused domain protein [Lachnospiraceae bacterium]
MAIIKKLIKKIMIKKAMSKSPMYLYGEDEQEEVEKYICDAFGEFASVFHELVSPDIHLDVCLIPPSDEEPYYKLVTLGAGAYKMNVPDELLDDKLEYAEYVIYLPENWNIKSNNETDFWPIRVLKGIARLPIYCDTWLGYGHTTQDDEEGTAYASNTQFNSVVLDFASNKRGDIRLKLSSGKVINFYEVIPLYPEELQYKLDNDADILFDRFKEKGIKYKVVDIDRKNACKE